jgi:hypothetical protein|tara:strand:- start:145 stop:498 length:354 start_codon:yes stop_codon:yes gene_type:complete
MEEYLDLLKLILPVMLVEHFDLVKSEQLDGKLNLYFEERNVVPQELNTRQLVSKGYHNEVVIQDFPLRGKFVFLHVKRRRWTDKQTNQIVQRDWNEVAKGTRMTVEFASFLKSIDQY